MSGRQYLTPREWAERLDAQGGTCACGCGRTPGDAPFIADHSIPNFFRPGKPDQLLAEPCHGEKTREDRRRIDKTRRQAGETGNGRKVPIARHRDPWSKAFREKTGFKWKWPKRELRGGGKFGTRRLRGRRTADRTPA